MYRPDARWSAAAVIVLTATATAITGIWGAGGGVEALFAVSADSLASIARLAGLLSAGLLLLQVILMARIPLFERAFGRAEITRRHRLTGIWSFVLLLVHIVLITIAYSLADGSSLAAEAWNIVVGYPGMVLASLGVVMIVLVMVTSARGVRRRLRYESWHLLHLYAYLGIALTVPHMIWTGTDFIGHPLATAFWWALWAAAAGCVLVFRLARPLLTSLHHRIRVAEVVPDGSRAVTVRMSGRNLDRLGARAGQHFTWRFLDGTGWSRGHPFSLSASPTSANLQITARTLGDGSRRLTGLPPGTRVLVEGPFGQMTGRRRRHGALLLIGAGSGVAPLVSLLESEPFAPGEAVLVTRDHDAGERVRSSAIAALIAERGLVHCPLDGARAVAGSTWLPEDCASAVGSEVLRRLLPADPRTCDVFLCGPSPWMQAVRRDLRAAGVPARSIHAESFTTERGGRR